jgi:hypothetical protein
MSSKAISTALKRLAEVVAPPRKPLQVTGTIRGDIRFPDDYLALIGLYGSGSFQVEGAGAVLTLLNPYWRGYWKRVQEELELVREFKEEEGDEYIPYEIHPDSPGLLIWGYGEGRKHYFWLTEGKPNRWPNIVMYDIELFTRFDIPMVVFLQRLLCGELDCTFIGLSVENNRIDPSTVTFNPEAPK